MKIKTTGQNVSEYAVFGSMLPINEFPVKEKNGEAVKNEAGKVLHRVPNLQGFRPARDGLVRNISVNITDPAKQSPIKGGAFYAPAGDVVVNTYAMLDNGRASETVVIECSHLEEIKAAAPAPLAGGDAK